VKAPPTYFKCPRWLVAAPVSATAKIVLLALTMRRGRDHDGVWPSLERIAKDAHVDRKTVISALRIWVTLGVIHKHKRHRESSFLVFDDKFDQLNPQFPFWQLPSLLGLDDLAKKSKKGTKQGVKESTKSGTPVTPESTGTGTQDSGRNGSPSSIRELDSKPAMREHLNGTGCEGQSQPALDVSALQVKQGSGIVVKLGGNGTTPTTHTVSATLSQAARGVPAPLTHVGGVKPREDRKGAVDYSSPAACRLAAQAAWVAPVPDTYEGLPWD
jgi:hypothetical protein